MVVDYGDQQIHVESDNLKELHDAVARIEELNLEAQLLRDAGASGIVLERHAHDGNEYYGFADAGDPTGHVVTFGQYRNGEGRTVPFFPREDGYWRREEGPGPQPAPVAAPEAAAPEAYTSAPVELPQRERPVQAPPPSDAEPPLASEEQALAMHDELMRNEWTRQPAEVMLYKRYGVKTVAEIPAHKVESVLRDAGNVKLLAWATEQVRRYGA